MKTRISDHIKAAFPVLAIESSEEKRIRETILCVGKELKRKVYQFTITSGTIDLNEGTVIDDSPDPGNLLDLINKNSESSDKVIWIYLDPGKMLDDDLFQRKLKDTIDALRHGNTLILVQPSMKIPENIAHLVKVINSPLPGKEELQKVVRDIVGDRELKFNHEKSIDALSGMTTEQASDAIALSIVQEKNVSPIRIMQEKCSTVKRDYFQVVSNLPKITDIGGLETLKDWLKNRTSMFSKKALDFGVPTPKGVLMVGVPGCGKSLTAKAIATILELPCVRLDVGALMGGIVGDSERNTREAIKIIEAMSPVVLWIDELDKQFSTGGADGNHEVTKRVMSSLLTWLQEKTAPVFVCSTANNIIGLANAFPELLRKGRWDEIFFVDLPNETEREAILNVHIQKAKRDPAKFDIVSLVGAASGFSGAEIESVVKEGIYIAFGSEEELNTSHILAACKSTVPQSKMAKQSIDELRRWADGRTRKASMQEEKATAKREIEE
jgi:ATP-dependent 26S proteasome regulatory subunit